MANVLPERYRLRIERIPGMEVCSKSLVLGGFIRPSFSNFAQFAVDADGFSKSSEMVVTPEQIADFIKEKSSCVVGSRLLERFGWKIGDESRCRARSGRAIPRSTIRGVYHAKGIDETIMFFHHDYFDELKNDRRVGQAPFK